MNKMNLLLFISFLAISAASYGHEENTADSFEPILTEKHLIGGCTVASLGPAYHPDLCNSDGTYNKNAPLDLVWGALHQLHHVTEIALGATSVHGIPINPTPGLTY